jgi:uncharacterized membrane protein
MKYGFLVLCILLLPCLGAVQDFRIISTVSPPSSLERLVFQLYNDYNTTISSAVFTLPLDASSVRVEDSYGPLQFSTHASADTVKLAYSFSLPIKPGESRLVIIEYSTQGVVRQKNSDWEFLMVFNPTSPLSVEHTLELPSGYTIIEGSGFVVSPQATIEGSEGTTRVVWKAESKATEPIVFIARFTKTATDISMWLVGLAVALLLAGALFLMIVKKSVRVVRKIQQLDTIKVVKDEDRKILEMVIRNPGIKQNEVQDALNWSKASVSKRVTNMIGQGLLVKKKRGKRNYLYLGPKL